MSRRLLGALLALLSVVGVTVAASVAGHRVAGLPTIMTFPGPPAVGDCLDGDTADDGPWFSAPSDFRPRFGPCASSSIGEVVAVRATASSGPPTSIPPGLSGDCRQDALSYAGLRMRGRTFVLAGAPNDDPVAWTYSVDMRT